MPRWTLRQRIGHPIDTAPVNHRLRIERAKPQSRQKIPASACCAPIGGDGGIGMSGTSIAIRVAGDDTQAHAAAITADDEAWVKALSESGKQVRIRIPAEDDTEGHESSSVLTVLVDADDDDVEGHALSLHFPSAHEANQFRRNLMAAGLITATLAVGAAGGVAIGSNLSNIGTAEPIVVSQYEPNIGQYDSANMGGTVAAIQGVDSLGQANPLNMGGVAPAIEGASSLGQADPANMGGVAPAIEGASSLGQADPANMGGVAPAIQGASSLGQADPANMGGVAPAIEGASSLGQADPANMGGTPPAAQDAEQGQYNPANMGGTPQADADEE
jgi:hypothetical protein